MGEEEFTLNEEVGYNLVIIRRVVQLLCLDGDVDTVKKISQLSKYHNTLAQPYLTLLRGSGFACQCDCKAMTRFKIYDEVRRWKCDGCCWSLDAWAGGCWTRSRFREANLPVCKACYWKHWHQVGIHPIDQCLRYLTRSRAE